MLRRLLALLWLLLIPVLPADAAMDYAKQVLIGADFSSRDLRGVTFNLTNLREADLSNSDLRAASLFGPSCKTPTSPAAICAKPRLIQRSSMAPTSVTPGLKARLPSTPASVASRSMVLISPMCRCAVMPSTLCVRWLMAPTPSLDATPATPWAAPELP